MMRRLVLLAPLLLVGSLSVTYSAGTTTSTAEHVEMRMGPLASGSSVSADFTEGDASVAGSLLSVETDVLYLNNTNASGAWHVKLVHVGASGLSNLVSLEIGIDNGTAAIAQLTGALGALTQTEGTYVRLEPASANRIYVTQAVSDLLAPDTRLTLDVLSADDATGAAFVVTNANITIT